MHLRLAGRGIASVGVKEWRGRERGLASINCSYGLLMSIAAAYPVSGDLHPKPCQSVPPQRATISYSSIRQIPIRPRLAATKEPAAMDTDAESRRTARHRTAAWLKYIMIAVVFEKIIQHGIVSIAFFFNWAQIRSTVAVPPDVLLLLGAIIAGLFILSLWGIMTHRHWALNLVIALAVVDIVGECAAQGTLSIVVTVSFLVATLLLILALLYRRQERHTVTG
jgi:hypothetical protein